MDELVGASRDDVFLSQQLYAVSDRLEETPTTNAVWPNAVLDATERLAFDECGVGKDPGEYGDDKENGNRDGDGQQHPLWCAAEQRMVQFGKQIADQRNPSQDLFRVLQKLINSIHLDLRICETIP